jgi:hypothetical protein
LADEIWLKLPARRLKLAKVPKDQRPCSAHYSFYSAIIGGVVLVVQLALMLLGFMSGDLSLPDLPIDDDTPDIAGAIGVSGDSPLG